MIYKTLHYLIQHYAPKPARQYNIQWSTKYYTTWSNTMHQNLLTNITNNDQQNTTLPDPTLCTKTCSQKNKNRIQKNNRNLDILYMTTPSLINRKWRYYSLLKYHDIIFHQPNNLYYKVFSYKKADWGSIDKYLSF